MKNKLKPNADTLLGTRKLPVIPDYFEILSIQYKYNTIDAVERWIKTNLKGRYAICKSVNISDTTQKIETVVKIGFENQKEASYFLLACPILKYS
jgi:hypothetical protein